MESLSTCFKSQTREKSWILWQWKHISATWHRWGKNWRTGGDCSMQFVVCTQPRRLTPHNWIPFLVYSYSGLSRNHLTPSMSSSVTRNQCKNFLKSWAHVLYLFVVHGAMFVVEVSVVVFERSKLKRGHQRQWERFRPERALSDISCWNEESFSHRLLYQLRAIVIAQRPKNLWPLTLLILFHLSSIVTSKKLTNRLEIAGPYLNTWMKVPARHRAALCPIVYMAKQHSLAGAGPCCPTPTRVLVVWICWDQNSDHPK